MDKHFIASLKKNYMLYLMLVPVAAYFIVFCYAPMFGVVIAFQDYFPRFGILGSNWVGLKNFRILFGGVDFPRVMRNTLTLSMLSLVIGFPMPILLSLLLNEARFTPFKRFIQTLVYMPHFLSWVIVASLVTILLDGEGIVNQFLRLFGSANQSSLLMSPRAFYPILITAGIWKEVGWGTLIYLAAIVGVDPELYESAVLDGATRFKQMLHITLPSIQSTVIILLILNVGGILNTGLTHILLLMNSMTREVAETLDVYVYYMGIVRGGYSLSTAVGLFKSVVGLAMIMTANAIARRLGESSLL